MQRNVTKIISLLLIVLFGFTLLFSFGCNGEQTEQTPPEVTKPETPTEGEQSESFTLLVYMCGSTLESKSGEATKNINSMLFVDLPEGVNVVLQTGGTKSWKTDGISPNSTDRFIIENNSLKLVDRITNKLNFGESSTLTDFIKFGLENYPADHTALILWDHGGGSLSGVCFDENFGMDGLTLAELDTALSDAEITQKFEFIGFDACLMATYECAKILAPYSNYMVASQEKEPAGGWDYQSLLTNLGKENFYDSLLTAFAQKSAKKNYYTLSAVDLGGIDEISEMFSSLIVKMYEGGKRNVVTAIEYSSSFGLKNSGLYDLGDIFNYYGVAGNYSNYIKKVNSELCSSATGLSIYFPLYNSANLDAYLSVCPDEDYVYFLKDFAENSGETIRFESYAQVVDGKMVFTLDKTCLDNFAEAEFVLFKYETHEGEEPDSFYLLGTDDDVDVQSNKVTVAFEGLWAKFGGSFLSCTVIDVREDYTIYQAPITINGEFALLLFGTDSESGDTEIIGAALKSDDYGRIVDLNDGDEICVVEREYGETVYTYLFPEENTFTYSGQEIEIDYLPNGYYQFTAFVRDIYGYTYKAGTAVVLIENGNVTLLYTTPDETEYPESW
jgi:hypothetical protein